MALGKKRSMEIKVGLTVGMALLMLAITIFTVEKFHFGDSGYTVEVTFDFVDAIKPQSDVVIGGGVKIGHVSDIMVQGDQVILKVTVKNDVRIPSDAKFKIMSKGVMGDKYLNVVAQKDTGNYLSDGDRIKGMPSSNMDDAFKRLGQVADSVKMLLGDPELTNSFGQVMKNFSQLSGRLDRIIEKNETDIDAGIKDISNAAGTISRFSKDLESVSSNLDDLLSKENVSRFAATLKNMETLSARLDKQVAQLEKNEGTIGVLLHDKELASDLKTVIRDLKENPWKLLWKK